MAQHSRPDSTSPFGAYSSPFAPPAWASAGLSPPAAVATPAYTASEARALAAEARATAAEAMATAAEARYTDVVRHTEDSIQSALSPVLRTQTVRQVQHEQAYGDAMARLAAAEDRARREAEARAAKEAEAEAVQRQLRAALETASRMQTHFEAQVESLKRRADDAEERARR
eukprot:394654-Prymnesium_polylepis.1